MKLNLCRAAFLSSASALIIATPAYAQSEGTPPSADASAADKTDATTAGTGSDTTIYVTGSRTVKDGTRAPTPVTVVTSEELLARAPNNIADALNQLPQFVGSQGASQGGGAFTNTARVASFLNLRNLGSQRVLLLLNGMRLPPTSATGQVDTDTLPQALVSRVDVVTGGASAVYGSDALSGVINYVLDTKFTGLKLSGQIGISQAGDLPSRKISIAAGKSFFEGRAHVIASFDYFKQGGIVNADREAGNADWWMGGNGTAANPFTTYRPGLSRTAPASVRISGGPLNNMFFDIGGVLRPYNFGIDRGNPSNQEGGDGGQIHKTRQHAIVPVETYQGFFRGSYDLTPGITAYVQAGYAKTKNGPFGSWRNIWTAGSASNGLFIISGNAFLRPEVQAQMDTLGVTRFTFSRGNNPDDPRVPAGGLEIPTITNVMGTESKRFTAGFEGALGDGWEWDVGYSYGWSEFKATINEPFMPRVVAALDAVRNPATGAIVCRVTLTAPTLWPGCQPLNVMGLGASSQASLDYIAGIMRWSVLNKMHIGAVNLKGSPFSLGAGPVTVAVGAEYREQTLDQLSNGDPAIPTFITGLDPRGVPPLLRNWSVNNVGQTHGAVTVKEFYGEVAVPLLADKALFNSLDLNGAARYTNYSTSGGVVTWKAGLIWSPFQDLRLRGTWSVDIRAPSLSELFAGTQSGQQITTDPRTGLTGVISSLSGGNAGLVPEKGDTKVLGFIYQPSWLPGASLSVDRYSITIDDQIATPSPIVNLADCEASNGTSPACDLIQRPLPFSNRTPANFPTALFTFPVNIARLKQEGFDIEASYRFEALGGTLTLRGLMAITTKRQTQLSASSPIRDEAGFAIFPKVRGSVSVNYQNETFGLFLQTRATGKYRRAPFENAEFYRDHAFGPNKWYTDMTITYALGVGKKSEWFLTVNNLLDVEPPILATFTGTQFPTNPDIYDIKGRFFTTGLRFRF